MMDNIANAATSCFIKDVVTLKRLVAAAKFLEESAKHTLFIWTGDYPLMLEGGPRLVCSKLVNKDSCYIVAGVGMIAGKKAYKIMRKCGFILRWSSRYVPLEKQSVLEKLSLFFESYEEDEKTKVLFVKK